jgi:hypothetical protein
MARLFHTHFPFIPLNRLHNCRNRWSISRWPGLVLPDADVIFITNPGATYSFSFRAPIKWYRNPHETSSHTRVLANPPPIALVAEGEGPRGKVVWISGCAYNSVPWSGPHTQRDLWMQLLFYSASIMASTHPSLWREVRNVLIFASRLPHLELCCRVRLAVYFISRMEYAEPFTTTRETPLIS